MKKAYFVFIHLVLAVSLFFAYVRYVTHPWPIFITSDKPSWDSGRIRADGYVAWKNKDRQPKTLRQFFSFSIRNNECLSVDVVEMVHDDKTVMTKVSPDNFKECEIVSIDESNKVAAVKLDDLTVTITPEQAIVYANAKGQEGGSELVSRFDPRVNKNID